MGYPKGYYPPEDGWEAHTWYLIIVSFNSGNPPHHSLFYSGFLNGKDNQPGGYSCIIPFNGWSVSEGMPDRHARYFKVVKKVIGKNDLPNIEDISIPFNP